MTTTIATLEARARINRQEWNTDKAALLTDISSISAQLDTLSRRFGDLMSGSNRARVSPSSGTTTGGAGATTVPMGTSTRAAQDASQSYDAAANATQRLSQAQRDAENPWRVTAKAIRDQENEVRLFTRTLGDSHPVTQASTAHLNELKNAASATGQQSLTLKQQLGQLIGQMSEGEGAAAGFGRGILQSVGGISLIAGGAAAAGALVAQLVQQLGQMAFQAAAAGIAGNASMEQYQVTFKTLLGSAYEARSRLADLAQFANTTPFNLPEVVDADKVLQTFGGDALATGKNLTLVGDIASGTGRQFQDVALWVGRAYDALQSGRPWGEAAMRLQEMGALSGTARARLEDLQASGASGAEVWAAFNKEMARFSGLMQEQSQTAVGLYSTLQDLQNQFLRTATVPVFENYKAFLGVATSPQGQSQLQKAGEDTAAVLRALIPLADAVVLNLGGKVVTTINQVGGALSWLDSTFGLFGHTVDGSAKQATQSVVDMRQGTVHAFSDIGEAARDAQHDVDRYAQRTIDNANQANEALSRIAATRARLSNEGGPANRQADAQTSIGVQAPPGFSSWEEWNRWNTAHNQIITDTNASRAQADLARQQAGDQQYLTAQLAAQNAQAQAQAAMDRLKLTDQTFLQGQASNQITSTQIQTAIERVKLGNKQLMDASIQADAAQLQVQAALTRIQGTNSLILTASVEADTASTQASTALNRAKAGSQEWVEAQVGAEKAQRDTQDALDRARVSAGLIDETQTAAFQRDRARLMTPIEFVKQGVQDVHDIIQTGLDSANKLATLHIPSNVADKMRQVTAFEDDLLKAQQAIAAHFSRDQVIKLYEFGQAAQEGVGYFAGGVNALSDVAKLQVNQPDRAGIDAALQNIDYILAAVDKQAQKHDPTDVAKLGLFAQTGQSLAQFLSTTADAFGKIQPQRFDLRGQINLLFENIDHALHDVAAYASRWKVSASDDVRQIDDNVGAIMDDLNKALDPFGKIQDAAMVGDYEIDMAVDNVDHAISRLSKLADSPALQGTSLTRLQQASSVLGSVFSGLKTALDTITGLVGLQDASGTVDVGADLDQFFLDQVPAYASTWEAAMTRIGNAAQGAGNRVRGALGVGGGAPSQVAGSGAGAGGNGTTYVLNIGSVDVSKDPVIEELVKRIFAHLNLVGGGIPVGAGG